MRAVGIEMLNKRGGGPPSCALRLEVIADAAGVSVGTARDALNVADTIGLVTTEHLRGFYDIRIRSPEWLPALRERIEETAGKNRDDLPKGEAPGVEEAAAPAMAAHEGPRAAGEAAEDEAVAKAPINWNHLNADDQEKLEKMMAPYRAIEEAGAKGKKGGVIGHSGMCVLEAFLTFRLSRPGEKLRLSREAIARAALLSPRTVGRTIRHLADLGLITVQGGGVYEINPSPRAISAAEPQTIPAAAPSTAP
jgi:hypothetical protein